MDVEIPVTIDVEIPEAPALAFDRGMRTFDKNGYMNIKDCNISKANVCPYLGREIPGYAALGLDPDKVYNLYRDAEELEKAAPTFERVPLMLHHVVVSPKDIKEDFVIGTMSNVRWVAPHLKADLTVWRKEGIDAIENGTQEELSPGYHYVPVMNSGVASGRPFEGRMTQIHGNHEAIVEVGRTGPDVRVNE